MDIAVETPAETRLSMEKAFYEKHFNFSYSGLNKLLWNPGVFYQHYIMGNKEDRLDSYLVNGKLIHCMLLEKQNINKLFLISPAKLPSSETLRPLIDKVFRHYLTFRLISDRAGTGMLKDFGTKILELMKEADYWQKLGSDAQRLEKVVTPETESYWQFLKNKNTMTLVDQANYDICVKGAQIVKDNAYICQLMGMKVTDFDDIDVINEELLSCDLEGFPFGLHGVIDNQVVNHKRKVIYINDLKNTNKELKDFPDTVEFFNYWMQAAIYMVLAGLKYGHLLARGYRIEFRFVVIDVAFRVYAFPVRQATLDNWTERLSGALEKAEWHYRNKSYDLPFEFATGRQVL